MIVYPHILDNWYKPLSYPQIVALISYKEARCCSHRISVPALLSMDLMISAASLQRAASPHTSVVKLNVCARQSDSVNSGYRGRNEDFG